jgi:acetyl esterase/lipase
LLAAAGVPVEYHQADGMIHGFMHLLANRLQDGDTAISDAAAALRTALTVTAKNG